MGKIPHYTTDIAAALEVFIRYADPNRTSLMPIGNGTTGLYWAVRYDDSDGEITITTGRTLPEAICNAALSYCSEGWLMTCSA